MSIARAPAHAVRIALFAALAVGWTWPLARHLDAAIPGSPGDNFSFVWNFWWMRRALASSDLDFFRTGFLFHPFGTPLADHPHTALPALIGATALGPWSIVTAHNLLFLSFVFANLCSMYALAWTITGHARASVLAAVVFGLSPYLAAHALGHFDLLAAWVLPLFALLLRRAIDSRSAAAGAGLVAGAAAFTAYYYVVYLGLLTVVYLLAIASPVAIRLARREAPPRRWRTTLACLATIFIGAAVAIGVSGGGVVRLGGAEISMLAPQGALAVAWLCVLLWLAAGRRLAIRRCDVPPAVGRAAVAASVIVLAVFALSASPLIWQAVRLTAAGEYVTPTYFWRSMPRGVDLLGPLAGHPHHPLFQIAGRLYQAWRMDPIEAVGWIGIVPAVLVVAGWKRLAWNRDFRAWRRVGLVFALLSLGPILTIAGFDTGLRLPEILLRYVPVVANARMPGRMMVCVFLALAVMLALVVSTAPGILRRATVQWIAIAAVALDYWAAPMPLTFLEASLAYRTLALQPPGSVCEVPFGVGDGLGGVGSQDRRLLYHATIHGHPVAGGFIGRMPPDAADRYRSLPITGSLLELAEGREVKAADASEISGSPCAYFIVSRAASAATYAYLATLPLIPIAGDADRQIFRLKRDRD